MTLYATFIYKNGRIQSRKCDYYGMETTIVVEALMKGLNVNKIIFEEVET